MSRNPRVSVTKTTFFTSANSYQDCGSASSVQLAEMEDCGRRRSMIPVWWGWRGASWSNRWWQGWVGLVANKETLNCPLMCQYMRMCEMNREKQHFLFITCGTLYKQNWYILGIALKVVSLIITWNKGNLLSFNAKEIVSKWRLAPQSVTDHLIGATYYYLTRRGHIIIWREQN